MKFKAKVIHGAGRGHEIGFPTINLQVLNDDDLPKHGVYRSLLTYAGEEYPSVLHYGPRETFDEHNASLEVHILDFDEDIYGEDVELEFLEKIRDVKKFKSKDALIEQIGKDVVYCKEKL